jgi:hypothetical protein
LTKSPTFIYDLDITFVTQGDIPARHKPFSTIKLDMPPLFILAMDIQSTNMLYDDAKSAGLLVTEEARARFVSKAPTNFNQVTNLHHCLHLLDG